METKTIELSLGETGRLSDYEIIHISLNLIVDEITDELDMYQKSDINFKPLKRALQLSFLNLTAMVGERMEVTDKEVQELEEKRISRNKNVIIKRTFTFMEIAALSEAVIYCSRGISNKRDEQKFINLGLKLYDLAAQRG